MAWVLVPQGGQQLSGGEMLQLVLDNRCVALARVGEEFYAFDDACPHMLESLSEGELDGYNVYCPMHQSGFDIRTGQVLNPPAETPLALYAVRRDSDDLWVELPD